MNHFSGTGNMVYLSKESAIYAMDVRDYLRMVHRERRVKLARRMALTAARFILVLLVSFILWFGLRRG